MVTHKSIQKTEPRALRNRGAKDKLCKSIEKVLSVVDTVKTATEKPIDKSIEEKVLRVVDTVKTATETPIDMEVDEINNPIKNENVEAVLLAHTPEMDEDPETDEFIRNYTDNENAAKLKTIITEKNKTIARLPC